ncbi:MAG: AI-2E family transporter, partial [Lactobacillus johnsonii]|nr:AI-2E family transporter [Lactobacillus johnsonii]
MIKRKSLLFWSAELLIVATLIWVCTKLDFLFHPIIVFISVIFVPLIVSIFLYYMTSPVFRLLMKIRLGKWQMKRGIASMVIVFGLLLLIIGSLAVL